MIYVTLSPEDEARAVAVGLERNEEAKRLGLHARFDPATTERAHMIGAMGELAFANALKLDWPARVNTFRKLPDVDPNWEVRWGTTKDAKVAVDDNPEIFVAWLTGRPPTFEVHGFIVAGWVQQNRPAVDKGSRGNLCHWVDIYHLTPINETFHQVCSWARGPDGWACAYCGTKYEGPTPEDRPWPQQATATATAPRSSRTGRKRAKTASPRSSTTSTTPAST